jgi:hypothetical protein
MKQVHIIFAISMSFLGLNAMSDPSNVTKWEEICKDPREKQKLMTVYKDFCQKRVKENIVLAAAGWTSYVAAYAHRDSFTTPLKTIISCSLAYAFALSSTYFLVRNSYRAHLANQENLYYLNRDIHWLKLKNADE